MRGWLKLSAAAVLATAGLLPPAQLARADDPAPQTRACVDAGVHYTVYSPTSVHIPTGVDWKSGPGGTVTSHVETGHTVSSTVSISGSADIGTIVARAKAQLGLSVSTTSSRSSSHTYSHNVSPGKYGHMQFGNWGYHAKVKRWVVDARCNVTSTTYGTTKLVSPALGSWGFKYWETSS